MTPDARPHGNWSSTCALLRLCRARRDSAGLAADEFLRVLEEAFAAEPLEYDPAWASHQMVLPEGDDPPAESSHQFAWFETRLIRQIVDLRQMRDARILDNELRYFGVDSPRGSRWYNFDPASYLECGAEGSLGGWEPGDATARKLVDGQVVAPDAEGRWRAVDPQDVPRPVYELPLLTWHQLADFLHAGQMYE